MSSHPLDGEYSIEVMSLQLVITTRADSGRLSHKSRVKEPRPRGYDNLQQRKAYSSIISTGTVAVSQTHGRSVTF